MIRVTCRLTAKNRDQIRNPTLGNRVWATFTFLNPELEAGGKCAVAADAAAAIWPAAPASREDVPGGGQSGV